MRKQSLFIFVSAFMMLSALSGCSNSSPVSLVFENSEYEIYSGDKVTVKGEPSGVTYYFVDNVPTGVNVDKNSGTITFENKIENYTQVLYAASLGEVTSDPVVLTLLHDVEIPTLQFVETTEYICSGNYIYATSSTNSSIRYSLKTRYPGVKIDGSTGQVTYTSTANEGDPFTVVISSNGATLEKEFKVAKEKLVAPITLKQATELEHKTALCFYLDFSAVDAQIERTVTKLITGRHVYDSDSFVYDSEHNKLTVKASTLEDFKTGENILTIVTKRNMVNVTVVIADKIITTAEEIVAINDSQKALSGYYILGNDIDLSDYLSPTGKGYDSGSGWRPIGLYHDVTDGTAFNDTFKGTFDGNGHTISGYRLTRRDELGFNAGLFGYVYNLATIKNLGIVSSEENTTASFAGALAGFNEGKIYNCWTNVNLSNDYGGNNYRIIGGFVGRNSGTIDSCYALGKVAGESQVGAFVGLNEGTITNCYASKEGYELFCNGLEPINSRLFDSKAEMIASEGNMNLDEQYWDLSKDSYPELKSDLVFYYPYNLTIENNETDLVKGEVIDLDIQIYPSTLHDQYLDKVVIEVDDPGCVVNNFKIDTAGASKNEIKVTARIDEPGLDINFVKEFFLYSATESVEIVNNFTNSTVEPGEKYLLSATVSPLGANNNIKWSILEKDIIGITIEGDELIVSEEAANNEVLTFTLVANSSGVTDTLTLTIVAPRYLMTPMAVVYKDDANNIAFTLPNDVDLTNAKLFLFKQPCEFSVNGKTITVDKKVLEGTMDTSVGFKLELSNGDIYRLYASYISHNRYTVSNLPADSIEISSVEQFESYFNVTKFGATKYANNYDKTYYLTADIDFGGRTIYGIGYADDDSGENRPFSGKIYGFGHKISNAVITDNEKYLTLTSTQKENNYRASRYGVGFFGTLSGEVYDLVLDNFDVSGNSWNGSFAGIINGAGIVENVSVINSKVTNANGNDQTGGGLTTGKFAASCEGIMLACSFNGTITGLLGR